MTISTFRAVEKSNGHIWGFWNKEKVEVCKHCGLVRRADKLEKPCKGVVKITLR